MAILDFGTTLMDTDEIAKIVGAIPAYPGKISFARDVDALSRSLYKRAGSRYPSKTYTKLIILKLANLLLAQHAAYHRHSSILARPIQLLIDPANTCQLQCPGCVHSRTAAEMKKAGADNVFDWPDGNMAPETFDTIENQFVPYAFASVFFNYGEPLINKHFPDMVRQAGAYLNYTWTSTNLSLSFDVDDVVSSGLDLITLSIDGTSQQTLERYRQRAKWDLCLENMKKLVEAKRRLQSRIFICWQFLTFEHNLHEVSQALDLAKEIGIDCVHVARPFDVSSYDPDIKVAVSPYEGWHNFNPDQTRAGLVPKEQLAALEARSEKIDALFDETWEHRIQRFGIEEEESRAGGPTCNWLYQNITFDAAKRTMPCCGAPTTRNVHLAFGSLDQANVDVVNTKDAKLSRLFFGDRDAFHEKAKGSERVTYCANCPAPPPDQFDRETNLPVSLFYLDAGVLLTPESIGSLTKWSNAKTI